MGGGLGGAQGDGVSLAPELLGNDAVRFPFVDVGHALLVEELANGLPERFVIGRISETAGDGVERHEPLPFARTVRLPA